MYRILFKRCLDVVISLTALILLAAPLLIVFVLVKLDSPGPLFFSQIRLGYKGRKFYLYKIRTMTHKERGVLPYEVLKDNPEVTRVGQVLRRLKIDELPQLINVVAGDMSIVGPRPALPHQINEFNENGRKRLLARPGLTGLAQVNGNIYLTWPERWVYDKHYVENISFWMDVKIILKTVLLLINGEDKFIKKTHVQDSAGRIGNQ